MTELSLIVPCYNEAQNVEALYDRCLQVFEPAEFEVIFVNDGSKDDTYKKLQHLHEEYSNVLVVNFSRNFGKEAAIYAGLHYATGTYLSIIDADLQQDPEIVKHMTEILEKKPDVDVVAAYQKQRHEGKFMAWCKDHFYRFINRLSEVDLRENASDFRTFRRNVQEALLDMPECKSYKLCVVCFLFFFYYPFAAGYFLCISVFFFFFFICHNYYRTHPAYRD